MSQFYPLLLPEHHLAASRRVLSPRVALRASHVRVPAHGSAGAALAGGLWIVTRAL